MHSLAIAAAIVLTISGTTTLQAQGLARRVSVGIGGAEADWMSQNPVLSSDGRWVAFQSYASNLVSNDTNGCSDVFLHDRVTGTTTRVSVSSSGAQADLYSGEPAISPDGRFIVFRSEASNLVLGDVNGLADVFIHERITGRTHRVSVGPGGAQPNGPSGRPSVSADGRFVAFESEASNLVAQDRNGLSDVFLRDRQGLITTRLSAMPFGESDGPSSCPSISADGRTVAFMSSSSTFAREGDVDPDVFLFDARTRKLTLVSADGSGAAAGGEFPAISGDGSVVIFESAGRLRAADANPDRDVYAYRVHARQLQVVSVSSNGATGRSWDSPRDFGPSTRIAADSSGASLSDNGRYVAFVSFAAGIVEGEPRGAEVYVRDLHLGTTRCITREAGPAASTPCAVDPVLGAVECPGVRAQISGNGLLVGVQTRGAFIAADQNGSDDVYVVDLAAPVARESAAIKDNRKPEQGLSVR
jgi:Tol biopolymer transport system component